MQLARRTILAIVKADTREFVTIEVCDTEDELSAAHDGIGEGYTCEVFELAEREPEDLGVAEREDQDHEPEPGPGRTLGSLPRAPSRAGPGQMGAAPMNRDTLPTGAVIALATGELMVTARRLTARLPRLAESGPGQVLAAYTVVRARTGELWPEVMPEAVRDVMMAAAELAAEHGVTEVPASVARAMAGPASAITASLLELTDEWITAGRPERGPGGFTPPFAFASSAAFDRAEDEAVLSATAALLTLAHLVIPGRAEPEPEDQDDEPEPEDYDPGPEVDDEGGMSEYRYMPAEPGPGE